VNFGFINPSAGFVWIPADVIFVMVELSFNLLADISISAQR